MSKYIDAEKLYKKIDERMAKFAELEKETEPDDTDLSIFYQGKRKMCSEILTLITSLQQEQPESGSSEKPNNLLSEKQEQSEADLKIEIGHWMDSLDDKYCSFVEQYSRQDIKETARHFYELGRARKEE